MGKNVGKKRTDWSKDKETNPLFEGLLGNKEQEPPAPVYDDTPTHTHTPKIRERKTFRAQILTYPSLVERMDEYGKAHDLSRAEVFERAVSEFLERNT